MINVAGEQLIKSFEGLRLEAYLCPAGKWTIGYGHTGDDVHQGMRIPKAVADVIFKDDISKFAKQVMSVLKRTPTGNQFAAMVSFAYNVGFGAFAASTLLKRFNKGDLVGTSTEFKRWVYADGKFMAGLSRRRDAERILFLTPDKKTGGN